MVVVWFTQPLPAQLVVGEFRVRGPNGANDEFIEILNNTDSNHVVAATSGTGYGVAASNGVTRCSIPNGTVIPPRGHFLCVNSVGYSLASYPAGAGTTATGDATYTTDIPDNAGIAIFNNNSGGGSYSLANRFDAVGSTSEANTLYKEGTGYPALTPFSIDYSWVRDTCGKSVSITTFAHCPRPGTAKDTNNNAADFYFVDTNGTSAGGGQRLGAAGPENLSGPDIGGVSGIGVDHTRLDPCAGLGSPPNNVRDFTSDPANNSTFGTLDIRRTIRNNTGAAITKLRFRVVDLTTFPAPSGIADLRPRTSTAVVVTVDRAACASGTSNVTVQGTTLEQPASQPNGGGFNSSWGVGTVTEATPLPAGGSVDVRFLMGIQQTGTFKVGLLIEALPSGGGTLMEFSGVTDGGPIVRMKGDFNADDKADVVLRNYLTGQNAIWLMNGTAISEVKDLPGLANANYRIEGTADFNGDWSTDILLRNYATGQNALWLMSGTDLSATLDLPLIANLNYHIEGCGDFNGDDKPDIILRNYVTGQNALWLMHGTSVYRIVDLPALPNPDYRIESSGDFNNDMMPDLVLRNYVTGQNALWLMNGTSLAFVFDLPFLGNLSYRFDAVADYNNNGKTDIVLRNYTTGQNAVWLMTGVNLTTIVDLPALSNVSYEINGGR